MATLPYGDTSYDPFDEYDTQHILQNELNREDAGDGTPNTGGANQALTTPPPGPGAGATGYNTYYDAHAGQDPLTLLAGAYPEFLGRPAGPGEAALHYGPGSVGYAGGGLRGGVGEIYNSPEAVAYRTAQASGGGTTGGGSSGGGGTSTTAIDYANPYTGGAAASTRAPRLIQRGDQWVLTEHGNERPLQPGEVDAARNYVTQYAAQNPTGFIQAGSPGYDATQATTNEGYPRITGQSTNGPTGYGGVQLTPRTGGASGQWSGFNNDRALAGGDANSIKDAFFRFGQGFQFDPTGKSKEEIETFLKSQMPAAAAYGLKVLDVRGDQIRVATAENPEGTWVDVVGNAGGTGGSPWQWMDQSYLGDTGGGGGGTGGGGGQFQSQFQSIIGNRTPSYATLQALEPDLNRAGFKLVRNASGTGADLQLPTGEIVDVIAGQTGPTGGTSWQWLTGDGGGGGTTGGGGGGTTGGGGAEDPLTAGLGGSALFQQLMAALLQAIQGQRSPTNQANLQNTLNG